MQKTHQPRNNGRWRREAKRQACDERLNAAMRAWGALSKDRKRAIRLAFARFLGRVVPCAPGG